jgi:hypothetical protein
MYLRRFPPRPRRRSAPLLASLRHRRAYCRRDKPGPRLATAVQARIDAYAAKCVTLYPGAVRCMLSGYE